MAKLTLTFDNGPAPGITERVLDALGARDLTAIFFMVGSKAATPGGWETAQRVAAAGHVVGNHTFSHGDPLGVQAGRGESEIRDAHEVLRPLLGSPPLFRPNGRARTGPHLLDSSAIEYLTRHGYTLVTWNAVPRDFDPPPDAWVARALAAIEAHEHTVLALHDHVPTTPDALGRFLDEVTARGVEFSTDFPPECVGIDRGQITKALREAILA